ncbi:hypothetical protein DY000_02015270 [Brassica cretica]|uniref:No apical meristem-associated C-terminal domain-containing protein n=2 Tax=Brassica cretica TaxID=69181 RepID=A0ABQ7D9J1_BRACR|nr:hypothetical protein DY000_02015270 [Brassica cretica]
MLITRTRTRKSVFLNCSTRTRPAAGQTGRAPRVKTHIPRPISARNEGSFKRRNCEDGSYSACRQANETDSTVADEGTTRPMGVKASKAHGKKPMVEGNELYEFQTMWRIKQHDLALKEKLSKMKLLDSLIAKQELLADYEEALKKKLINELLCN